MAKQVINIGTNPNDGTGDPLRTAMEKSNDNFTELYDGPTVDKQQFNPNASKPAHSEGLLFYDADKKAMSYYNDDNDVTLNLSRELVIRAWNDTGATLQNGSAVRVTTGATNNLPHVILSQADTVVNASVIGVVTGEIANGESGYVTAWGEVGGLDTSGYAHGSLLFLSSSSGGALTDEEQPILKPVAVVVYSDTSEGVIVVAQRAILNPTCIGQATLQVGSGQTVGVTPVPVDGYSNATFGKNVDVLTTASGGSFQAKMVPLSSGATGYYRINFSVSMNSGSNSLFYFGIYINGNPVDVIGIVDLNNANIDSGSTSVNGISELLLSTTDEIEMYVYSPDGGGTCNYDSLIFNVERIGTV